MPSSAADPSSVTLARPSTGLSGAARPPGDKSISHRAVMFGAMADGETRIFGLLEGDDVKRTAQAMRALGARVERDAGPDGPVWTVTGAPWQSPAKPLYFGNAGTGSRLVMGAVAGQGVAAGFDGDASLRARPMTRILAPLEQMGAVCASEDGRLPVRVEGGALCGIDYALPKPSAQIKSAVLLAGLGAEGETVVRETEPSRDHTERMLEAFGATLDYEQDDQGRRVIRLKGGQKLTGCEVRAPGDPSSAAFLVAAALITEGSDVTVRDVLMNPHRIGFFETLKEMGAEIEILNAREASGEPIADIRARTSQLRGVDVPAARAVSMIDEYPILSALAAFAEGETKMTGIGELRVKESDRIAAMEDGLRVNGVAVESGEDWMVVKGAGRAPLGGARIETRHDHRIAMSFLVMGLGAQKPIEIDDAAMIATSFPNFFDIMAELGADIELAAKAA